MPHPKGLSRRQFIRVAGGVAGLSAFGGGAAAADRLLSGGGIGKPIASFASESAGSVRAFRSQPDLHPPVVKASRATARTIARTTARTTARATATPSYRFLGPWPGKGSQSGPLIVSERGEVVWFKPLAGKWASNVSIQNFRGTQALTWWEGKVVDPGFGQGEGVLVDGSYRELARVRAGNGRYVDLHELQITPQGTALFTCYPESMPADLSSVGGSSKGTALGSVIQEVDIRTGRVLLEWRSLDHAPIADSYLPMSEPYDYFHANSIDVLPDGNLLISARNTRALYKLDRTTGQVIWQLGGKRSDFAMGKGAAFAWQHDARQHNGGIITVFDDESDGLVTTEKQSRAIVLAVDETRRTVTLAREYRHPVPLLATAMGSVQMLDDGQVLVGWGTASYLTQFAADGRLTGDVHLPAGTYSYRGLGFPWQGTPTSPPALAVSRNARTGARTLYASWNGATEVTHWQVQAGARADQMRVVGAAPRRGFETVIPVAPSERYAAVTALDAKGHKLANSDVIRI